MAKAVNGKAVRVDAFASVSRILDAARRLFASGNGSATLNRIAQEAGVGIATLYRHFPNRQMLARAVYDQLFDEQMRPLLERFERTDTPRDVLLDMSERLLLILGREGGLATSVGDVAEATRELLRRNGDLIEGAVRRAQEAGNLRSDLRPADIPTLMTLVAAGFSALNEDSPRRYVSLLLDGLNPALAQPLPE
jgi:AcrR family transcriptional regulator